jgi:carbamoyltransferase
MAPEATCLGLHIGHDRGITLTQGSEITFHTAVERLDRKKHSDSADIPAEEIRFVLDRLDIPPSLLDAVCITYHSVEASRIARTLEVDFKAAFPEFGGRFFALDHHLAHALAALACSSFDEALVLVADGAGDIRLWGTQSESLFHVSRQHFYLVEERLQDRPSPFARRPEFYLPDFFAASDQKRQISLGLKYEQITYLCGFGPNQAGQTMALASFGEPLFDLEALLPRNFGFSLRYVDLLDRMEDIAHRKNMTLRQFAQTERAHIAATAQHFLERAITNLVDYIAETYNPRAMCFAGGVFLNCPTNRSITSRLADREVFFLPASHDEGQSIGAAAYAHWQITGTLPGVIADFPYLGFAPSDDECAAAFRSAGLSSEHHDDASLARRLAAILAEGAICGVARGRSEAGPRALGNRSILADPRPLSSKQKLDQGIKRRAEFRPYAPMVHAARADVYFEAEPQSPYMLLTSRVRPKYRERLRAVTHVDNSARAQLVDPQRSPFLAQLLLCFEELSGVAVLLNTSFNDEREPIVDSAADALRTYLTTDLDALVLGNRLHIKRGS